VRIRQVLVNLLANALKFTEQGSITLSVSGRELEDNRYEASFSVSDTGIGIPQGRLGQLFEAFRQYDGSLTRKFEGTGLGLAICRRLTGLMGGEIGVDTAIGEGSTFHFTINCEILPPSALADSGDGPAVERHLSEDRVLRVLLVEDNDTVREVIRVLLVGMGCLVDVVGDGEQAVAAVGRESYDVVLMDIQMPIMSGLEATEKMRSMKELRKRPYIIALTGHALPEHRMRCLEAGMDDYLAKPIRFKDLKAAVLKAV